MIYPGVPCNANCKKVIDRSDGESDLQEEENLRLDNTIWRQSFNSIEFQSWIYL